MPYARSAVFWFIGLLILVVAGFWKTYFSVFSRAWTGLIISMTRAFACS